MNNTTDVLTASSTLITVIAILYSLWYYDIDKYSRKELPKHEADRTTIRLTIKSILISKLIPLMLINTFYFIIFLPESINYVIKSISLFSSGSPCSFDPIIVSIIFMSILSLILVIILANKAIILCKKIFEKGV